jgi:hypothetical protein
MFLLRQLASHELTAVAKPQRSLSQQAAAVAPSGDTSIEGIHRHREVSADLVAHRCARV